MLMLATFTTAVATLSSLIYSSWICLIIVAIIVEIIVRRVFCHFWYASSSTRPTHVWITGGSTGLGLALATEYALAGVGQITLLGRSQVKLKSAKASILSSWKEAHVSSSTSPMSPIILTAAADVTDYEAMKKAIQDTTVDCPISHLICCAGVAEPGYFSSLSLDSFRHQMDVNYFGAVYAIKAALPHMIHTASSSKSSRTSTVPPPHIVLISSGCGYIGFIGYTAYSASKFALRGFAEALRNELLLIPIDVSIYYPGNMDTPGFVTEERTKPTECKTIEGGSALVSATTAARVLIAGLTYRSFAITNDVGISLLRLLGNGMAPRQSVLMDLVLTPLAIIIQTFYLAFMDGVVLCQRRSNSNRRLSRDDDLKQD